MNSKKLKYEKPLATNAGALSHVHGEDACASGYEAGIGCNNTGNYAAECGFGYNNGVQTICDSTGNNADNGCTANGSSAGQNCLGAGLTAAIYCGNGSDAQFGG